MHNSMSYDNAAYQAVLTVPLAGTSTLAGGAQTGVWTAGASTISYKFVAFTNMLLQSITTVATTIGTGVATAFTMGDVGTGNSPRVVRITNNGTTQAGTCTGTYQMLGSYVLPPGATAIASGAWVTNWSPATAYSTAIGTSAASVNAQTGVNNWALVGGGIPLQPGDTVNFVKGVDATEVIQNPVMELQILPGATV